MFSFLTTLIVVLRVYSYDHVDKSGVARSLKRVMPIPKGFKEQAESLEVAKVPQEANIDLEHGVESPLCAQAMWLPTR